MNVLKPKQKETVKVKKIGLRRTVRNALWVLFIAAFVFAVYKNFTGIDQHTVHEREVVEQEVVDTSGIESFVRNFAGEYYNWGNTAEMLASRRTALESYMTKALVQLNSSAISESGGATASMTDFKIWELSQLDDSSYEMVYTVRQKVTKSTTEVKTEYVEEPEIKTVVNAETGEVTYEESIVQKEVQNKVESTTEEDVDSCYMVVVYLDESGNMVIVKNPTISSIPGKSAYEPVAINTDSSVDSNTTLEIKTFLEKFFALYPTADSAELAYYVKNNALQPVGKEYELVEISSIVCRKVDDQIMAYVTVKYYDERTGVNQYSQFELGLEKSDNWFIVSNRLS